MKKLIFVFICFMFFTNCSNKNHYGENSVTVIQENETSISIKNEDIWFDYSKIKLNNHSYFFRSWTTKFGYGSDLVHNPDCSYCKDNNY